MRVLSAVLSHARNIPFDISRIEIGFIKRRIEQLNDPDVALYETAIKRCHCLACADRIPCAGKYRPTLRNRIDLTFGKNHPISWCEPLGTRATTRRIFSSNARRSIIGFSLARRRHIVGFLIGEVSESARLSRLFVFYVPRTMFVLSRSRPVATLLLLILHAICRC